MFLLIISFSFCLNLDARQHGGISLLANLCHVTLNKTILETKAKEDLGQMKAFWSWISFCYISPRESFAKKSLFFFPNKKSYVRIECQMQNGVKRKQVFFDFLSSYCCTCLCFNERIKNK